jgi:hypothetical protein
MKTLCAIALAALILILAGAPMTGQSNRSSLSAEWEKLVGRPVHYDIHGGIVSASTSNPNAWYTIRSVGTDYVVIERSQGTNSTWRAIVPLTRLELQLTGEPQ